MRNNPSALTDALVAAYRDGFFPMANPETGELVWCSPPMRGVLPLTPEEGLRVPRSLGRRIRSGWFRLTSDACFERVIRACAELTDDERKRALRETLDEALSGRGDDEVSSLLESVRSRLIESARTRDERMGQLEAELIQLRDQVASLTTERDRLAEDNARLSNKPAPAGGGGGGLLRLESPLEICMLLIVSTT